MRIATRGLISTALLAIGVPARTAPLLIPCDVCALPWSVARKPAAGHRRSPAALPYDELFRPGRAVAKGLADRWSGHVFEAGDSGFSIETIRRLASRTAAPETIGAGREKLSSGSVTLRYATGIDIGDSVSLGLSAGLEKCRFALDLARGHHVRGQSIGLVAGWNHGGAWRLEGGYRMDFGARRASVVEHGIELVQGAPRSQRGAWTAIGYTIGRSDRPGGVSFGVGAQSFRLTERDRLSLGASGRSDARAAFTASLRFR